MCDRIWYAIIDSKYKQEYLVIHIDQLEKLTKNVDNILLLTTIGGILGWYNFAQFNIIWASILSLLTGFRIMKTRFLISEQEIANLKAEYEFYVDHTLKLERLWIDCYNNRLDSTKASNMFENLRDEERLSSRIHKHGVVTEKQYIVARARYETDAFLRILVKQ